DAERFVDLQELRLIRNLARYADVADGRKNGVLHERPKQDVRTELFWMLPRARPKFVRCNLDVADREPVAGSFDGAAPTLINVEQRHPVGGHLHLRLMPERAHPIGGLARQACRL